MNEFKVYSFGEEEVDRREAGYSVHKTVLAAAGDKWEAFRCSGWRQEVQSAGKQALALSRTTSLFKRDTFIKQPPWDYGGYRHSSCFYGTIID